MRENCFDEGTIQAFLDGELESDRLEAVARHTALCDDCARLLQEAETGSMLAFSALSNEFNALVPTERIRTGLYRRIAEIEKPRQSVWQKLTAFLGLDGNFGFGGSLVAGFASLLLIVGFLAIVLNNRQPAGGNDETVAIYPNDSKLSIEGVSPNSPGVGDMNNGSTGNVPLDGSVVRNIKENKSTFNREPVQPTRIKYQPSNQPRRNLKRDDVLPKNPKANSTVAKEQNLLGEESYIKTIAALTEQVNTRKDEILKPSARIAYEKDMAMVDDAISKMKKEVRKNPKNEAAREVLRASYQNKIDLLNSVADKTELMASIR